MKSKIVGALICIASLGIPSQGQGISQYGENTHLLLVNPGAPWDPDSIYLGATFLRDTTKDFIVWLDFSDAGWRGKLSLVVPGGASDGSDSALYLFHNKENTGPTLWDLSDDTFVSSHIHHLDTIYFTYEAGPSGSSQHTGYTGPNRCLADTAWSMQDRYFATRDHPTILFSPDGTPFRVGRRFCAAGWIMDPATNTRTDTVEFAFEDNQSWGNTDYDFNDIIFNVTGIFLIKPPEVREIRLRAEPENDTIQAGDSIYYTATVVVDSVDSQGVLHTVIDSTFRAFQVSWAIQAPATGGTLVNGEGPDRNNIFTATMAYRSYTIIASISDQSQVVTKTLTVYVIPDDPYRLYVENAYDTSTGSVDLNNANPIDTLTMPSSVLRDSVYSVIRDRFGNYTGACTNTLWGVLPDTSIVTAKSGRANAGEGALAQVGPPGTSQVFALNQSQPSDALMRDTFVVVVDPATYDGLRYVTYTGGVKRVINALQIALGEDTLIYSEGHREDGIGGDNFDGWVRLSVGWTLSSNLTSSNPAPGSGSQWLFAPIDDIGSGTVTITSGSLQALLPVTVDPGAPARMVLYSTGGDPTALTPYQSPAAMTYPWTVGSSYSIVAKLFDAYGNWLQNYENAGAPVDWEVRYVSNGQLVPAAQAQVSPATGALTSFSGTRAFITVEAIATFQEGAGIFLDTVRTTLQAGSWAQIVIEPTDDSTVSLNAANPINQVQLQSADTTRNVYAILRDNYGNWVSRALSATWASLDTAVVSVSVGSPQHVGIIRREADSSGATYVTATQGGLTDSVRVVVDNITYTALRLVVNHSGLRDIDTLQIRTDQDTTLYALGQRSDNGQWVYVQVTWETVSLLGVTPPAVTVDNWTLQPTVTDTGLIRITRGSVSDSVTAMFQVGLPTSMVVYPRDIPPGSVGNDPYPAPSVVCTLTAGQDTNLVAYLFDQNGVWLSSLRVSDNRIQWSRNEIAGSGNSGTFSTTTGYVTVFSPTDAYNTVELTAMYSSGGTVLNDRVRFYIKPNIATHLVIEGSPNPSVSPNQDNPLNLVQISSGDTLAYAYAVLRDALGNFVSASPATDWTSLNTSIVTAREGVAAQGQGEIFRVALTGQTEVVAQNRNNPSLIDTIAVSLDVVTYDSILIVVNHGGLADIDSLVLPTDQDTTLLAIGKRSDNGQWDNIRVNWSSLDITTSSAAPQQADQWSFSPMSTDTGLIMISGSGTGGTIYDTITVLFPPGAANRLVIFPRAGQPYSGGNNAYDPPSIVNVLTAGDTLPAVAKIFDHRDVWLSQYEDAGMPIRWHVIELAGNPPTGVPDPSTGYMSQFTSTRAFNAVYLYAEYNDAGILLRDTIRIEVVADTAHHMVLEGSPDRNVSPNADDPLYEVTLSPRDTVYEEIYAIIRDEYQNFVDYSRLTGWLSLDTTVATAQEGLADFGQGRIERVANNEVQTRVAAWDLGSPLLTDTITVYVSDITYDAVRIVVNDGGLKDIDTLRIRTDQDTTLLALGQRSDNGQWDNLRVRWTAAGISLSPVPPFSDDDYSFSPVNVGTGTISVSAAGSSGTITDQVLVIIDIGLPDQLVIYTKEGEPGINDNLPYPSPNVIDTIAAGDTVLMVAKVFDPDGVWLSTYENAAAPVRWSRSEISGNPPTGVLTPSDGHKSELFPENAYNTLYVIAEFNSGGIRLVDTVRFYVKPGPPSHVVLEAGTNPMSSPNNDNPAGVVTLSSRDTVGSVYAVLRDKFGNYVSFSTNNDWSSVDTTVVTADDGATGIGEGRIIRAGAGGGETYVIGESNQYPGFRDTVRVVLSTISYDSLRIVVVDTIRVEYMEMGTDEDTTLIVQGKRSDNQLWENVAANWVISSGLSTNPSPPSGAEEWSFSPADTGMGWIRVTLGNDATTIPDTVRVVFNPGPAARLVLYPGTGAPSIDNVPYASPVSAMTVAAGDSLTVVAKLVDHQNVWLGDTSVIWSIEELVGTPPTGSLSDTAGESTVYTVTKAFNSVYLLARYEEGSKVLRDTLYITVRAGAPDHLVIEGDQNWQFSPDQDNPLDSITLTNIETYRSVYAIVRDRLGNFVEYSQRTDWTSLDTAIVTAIDGISSIGEGIIENRKIGADTVTYVIAGSEEFPGMYDTLRVNLLEIYFEALRIVVGDSTVLDSLFMSTNDDTTLRVQGRRSDTKAWVNIQARWSTSSGMATDPSAPQSAQSWSFSPSAPDTGWISVTLNADSTQPDTLPVFFERGDPIRVDVELITPEEERIAGDTLIAVVRIRNTDGLVPGAYCDGTIYQDLFGAAGRSTPPVVIVDGNTDTLNQRPDSSETMPQCFQDGVDTVQFVLYYAPTDQDSLNRLYARINGVEGSTEAFRLLPSTLNSVVIEYHDGSAVEGEITLEAPNEGLYAFASGYDEFGNWIGYIPANWGTVSDTGYGALHEVNLTRTTRIYYSTAGVLYDERGCLWVTASDHPGVGDTVCITIIAPPAALVSAWTQDIDGNGYLDGIVVKFTKLVSFPVDYDYSKIAIVYSATRWLVDSIAPGFDIHDTVFTLRLIEDTTDNPQTSWTPSLTMMDVADADSVVEGTCADSAGPVIWRVAKQIIDASDRTQDIVIVTFSEAIIGIDVGDMPGDVFYVWEKNDDGSFTRLDGFLDGVGVGDSIGFLNITSSTEVRFLMSNGNALSTKHYLNIVVTGVGTARNSEVIDRVGDGNLPVVDNQRVQVVVQPFVPDQLTSAPNPAAVSSRSIPLTVGYDGEARQRVTVEGTGTVMSVPIVQDPTLPDKVIDASIKVYDLAGNVVAYSQMDNIMTSVPENLKDQMHFDYDIYWDGRNGQEKPVSPGVYRAVLTLDYRGSTVLDQKLVSVIGIAR